MAEPPNNCSKITAKPRVSPQLLLAISIAALVLVLAACLALLVQPRGQVRKLPDGSRLMLESITFGSEHAFDPRPWWDRMLNRQPVVGGSGTQSMVTPANSMVVWLNHEYTRKMDHAGPGFSVITDAHGCWFEPSEASGRLLGRPPKFTSLQAVVFTAFPRRDSSADLGLYDPYGRGPTVSYRVPIPQWQKFPTWEPGTPLPISARNGDLTFTFQRLVHREVLLRRREAGTFHVTRNGKLQPDWYPSHITVRDATGNVVASRTHGRLDDGTVRFSGLCRRESAWKLEVTFDRSASGRTFERRKVAFVVRP